MSSHRNFSTKILLFRLQNAVPIFMKCLSTSGPPACSHGESQSLHLVKCSGKRWRKKKCPIGGLETSAGTLTNQKTHGPRQVGCRSGTHHIPMWVLLKWCTITSLFTCESALPTLGSKCPCSTVYLKFLLSCFSSPWKFILVRFVTPQQCLCI